MLCGREEARPGLARNGPTVRVDPPELFRSGSRSERPGRLWPQVRLVGADEIGERGTVAGVGTRPSSQRRTVLGSTLRRAATSSSRSRARNKAWRRFSFTSVPPNARTPRRRPRRSRARSKAWRRFSFTSLPPNRGHRRYIKTSLEVPRRGAEVPAVTTGSEVRNGSSSRDRRLQVATWAGREAIGSYECGQRRGD